MLLLLQMCIDLYRNALHLISPPRVSTSRILHGHWQRIDQESPACATAHKRGVETTNQKHVQRNRTGINSQKKKKNTPNCVMSVYENMWRHNDDDDIRVHVCAQVGRERLGFAKRHNTRTR